MRRPFDVPGYRLLSHILERQIRDQAILREKAQSARLMRYNAARGMSRRRMEQIWGREFVRAVMQGGT